MQNGRLFEILYILLERGGVTTVELAERLEVSERTIRRDIDALSAAGIPVYAARGRNGGVRLLEDFVLSKSLLSAREQDEILYALQSLRATGTGVESALLARLSALFRREAVNWIDADFSSWGSPAEQKHLFGLLKQSLLEQRALSFCYYAQDGRMSQRTVEPVRLSFKGMNWYLQAWCRLRQDFRVFKLNRMEKVRLLDEPCTSHGKPPPLDEMKHPMPLMDITIRFSSAVAYRVYDEFNHSVVTREADGSLLVRVQWPPGTWGSGYLLSYGPYAEILSPPLLRRHIAKQAKQIAEIYQKPDTPCPVSDDKITPIKPKE